MKPLILVLILGGVVAKAQFGSLNWGSPSNIGPPSRPHSQYGKPPPRPFSGPPGGGGGGGGGGSYGGPPPPNGNGPSRGDYNEDPIPPMADAESTYDTQQLPAKLPILAPNGVVEIYNRVVDDLIRKLEGDLQRKELDPMPVVIRPTPPGPVRVPGYLQKRPFRRPGAALYRSTNPVQPLGGPTLKKKAGRSGVLPPETRFGSETRPSSDGENSSVRGAGKISKVPLAQDEQGDDDEKESLQTTAAAASITSTVSSTSTTTPPEEEKLPQLPSISSEEQRGSSEEAQDTFMKPRSEEFFPEPEEEEEQEEEQVKPKAKKEKKAEESEEEEKPEVKDVDSLIQHYHSKNAKPKEKYVGGKKNKPVVIDPEEEEEEEDAVVGGAQISMEESKIEEKVEKERKGIVKNSKKNSSKKQKKNKNNKKKDESEEDDEDDDARDDHDQSDDDFGPEPGTGGGKRPNGGYYPPGGPPAVPAKPNAELTGLARIRRASDVSVSVDARSAVITARLLVGPINVVINDSQEPMEKNVKATIPELEAELLLMERHGVVFLQRFTLDRAYGQDVEISIPKSKDKKKSKNSSNPNPQDPNHPANIETRRQTKMAAHVSMEVVKLLRSGNLRVNLMRTAQGAMSKLKLPIKKAKSGNSSKTNNNSKKNNKKEKNKKQ